MALLRKRMLYFLREQIFIFIVMCRVHGTNAYVNSLHDESSVMLITMLFSRR